MTLPVPINRNRGILTSLIRFWISKTCTKKVQNDFLKPPYISFQDALPLHSFSIIGRYYYAEPEIHGFEKSSVNDDRRYR